MQFVIIQNHRLLQERTMEEKCSYSRRIFLSLLCSNECCMWYQEYLWRFESQTCFNVSNVFSLKDIYVFARGLMTIFKTITFEFLTIHIRIRIRFHSHSHSLTHLRSLNWNKPPMKRWFSAFVGYDYKSQRILLQKKRTHTHTKNYYILRDER